MTINTITRVLFALAALGKLFGVDIPDEAINQFVDVIASIVLLWAMWKNNSFRKNAIDADEYLKSLNKKHN